LSERLYFKGKQGAIPYTLPPTNLLISLLPAPQLGVKRTIWRALKCRNKKQEARRKKKIEQEKMGGKSLDIREGGLEDIPNPPDKEGEGSEMLRQGYPKCDWKMYKQEENEEQEIWKSQKFYLIPYEYLKIL